MGQKQYFAIYIIFLKMLFNFSRNQEGVQVVKESASVVTETGSADQNTEVIYERYTGIFLCQYLWNSRK